MKLPLAIAAFATVASLSFAGESFAATADEIIAKAKCNKCHTATTTKKGPSWASVAEKYKGKPDPTPHLVDMLKTGGKDDHDKVPGATDAELKAVVAVVLSSK